MSSINSSELLPKTQILVVDDEPAIILGLKRQLTARGYQVRTASGGRAALQEIEGNPPDLLILDLMMPDLNGLQVTQTVRKWLHNDLPIIVLSARDEEHQKVEALDLGADDYLTKPFGLEELMARVRVALRHKQKPEPSAISANAPASAATLQVIGDDYLTIDLDKHQVWCESREVKLTPKQYELLKYLSLNTGRLITHRMLLRNVWGMEYGNENQYLHVFMGQLRQKIEPNPARPRYIITEPGMGYRFKLEASPPD